MIDMYVPNFVRYQRDKFVVGQRYEKEFGTPINWNRPELYTEQLNVLKISKEAEALWPMVDKYEVRNYVEEMIGEEYLNELYGVYNSAFDIDIKKLPDKFVLKATHGSGWNIVCSDKQKLDWPAEQLKLNHWLHEHFYTYHFERQYLPITPRVICEKYLNTDSPSFIELKFYCFWGKPRLVIGIKDRFKNPKKSFYSLDWKRLPFHTKDHDNPEELIIQKPKNFDYMIELASALSAPFRHVRVDLYNDDGRIYFGELTFSSNRGFTHFVPEKWNRILGTYYRLGI